MKKSFSLLVFILLVNFSCTQNKEDKSPQDLKMEWWREARFGMFIHWGPYSLWGGVYHGHQQRRGGAEWIMNRCKIPVAEYQQVAATFNPVRYDADTWVRLAKEAGMKYIVMTSKHHDGFAMFKSNASKFNIVDFTPYKKDVVDELAKACRKHGMKLGFYYSQAQDWNNPGGATARRVMAEGWANPDSVAIDAYTAAHNGSWDSVQQSRSMADYIYQVSIPQVRELLTNYGDIAIIWWDTPTNMTDEFAQKLMAELAPYPQVITNDRLKRPNYPGDHKTPEQRIPDPSELEGFDWEACMTMGSSWGYKSWDTEWKSAEVLVQNLLRIASLGGNYLLNIGPTPLGEIPQESIERLQAIGRWMRVNGEAVYGTQKSPVEKPDWGYITRKDGKKTTTLYLSVCDWPSNKKIVLDGLKDAKSAVLLANNSKLKTAKSAKGFEIQLPDRMPDPVTTVIKLELKGKLGSAKGGVGSSKGFDIVDE